MTKYIFVTGGVVSSVGKGIVAASVGRLLKSYKISVSAQKLDPYLNVDPGTMSPYQHGEVFVTEDGAETDLDLGHYERFIDTNLTTDSSVTTGQIYNSVIAKERRGDFLGGTIQVVPHVTSEIKRRIRNVAEKSGAEVILVEVGGTVGDIEGQPFLEAIRQMRNDVGRDNVLYIHVTLLPYISSTGELKTKPTQHSVKELRSIGIQPDIIVCRSDSPVGDDLKDKIALFCDVEKRAVVPLTTTPFIYEVPLILDGVGLGEIIIEKLRLTADEKDLSEWRELVDRMKKPKAAISIALVGKYVKLRDAYLSVKEALWHAALCHDRDVDIVWIESEDLEKNGGESMLGTVNGIVVPGGFGYRGIEGKVEAARYARENGVPYLGLCLGMHIMVIEFARKVLKSNKPNSREFDENTPYPVIDLLAEQKKVREKGGTMRLGLYPCNLVPGTKAAAAYNESLIYERHRHRFEFNNDFKEVLGKEGLIPSGLSPDGKLVEISEIAGHPWMVGVQFHPEFTSRPNRPHPLFRDFIGAAKKTLKVGDQRPLPLEPNNSG
ncbi:MAG: CTP synthase [Chloroflexi bacterium RBG_13_52_14]|nr:MAG: CTP synthase [Chloroflexi bacterium RBG_13_52_14]